MDLWLFVDDEPLAEAAGSFGVDGVVVDLETRDKAARQSDRNTQVTASTVDDVFVLRRHTDLPMMVRIDAVSDATPDQLDRVVRAGADEVLVPMVRTVDELDCVLDHVNGRVEVSCMVETTDVLEVLSDLALRPVRGFYVGLNDLGIERSTRTIFDAFVDGTVDEVVARLTPSPVGVAGLTHPEAGRPLPCRQLLDELVRLDASFTFLRRSFVAALRTWPGAEIVTAIRRSVEESRRRAAAQREHDREEFVETVRALPAGPWWTR